MAMQFEQEARFRAMCFVSSRQLATQTQYLSFPLSCLQGKKIYFDENFGEKQDTFETQVIIVGAGVSGLTAAQKLIDSGVDVMILEAQNYVGGRVKSFIHANSASLIEMGATWIHGAVAQNPIYSLAKENKLLSRSRKKQFEKRLIALSLQSQSGVLMNEEVEPNAEDLFNVVRVIEPNGIMCVPNGEWSTYEESIENIVSECNEQPQESHLRNAEDFIFDRMQHYLEKKKLFNCKYEELDQEQKRELQLILASINRNLHLEMVDSSSAIDDLSLPACAEYHEIAGANTKTSAGMTSLIDLLAKDIPKELIKLNSPVDQIQWGDKETVQCVTKDGTIWKSKVILVTCSLGVLQRSISNSESCPQFVPRLPTWKRNVIQNSGFGVVEKVFLRFEKRFWHKSTSSITLAWPAILEPKTFLDSNWLCTVLRNSSHTNSIDALPNDLPAWCLGISFVQVRRNGWMTLWFAGDSARQVNRVTDEQIAQTTLRIMRDCAGFPNATLPVEVVRAQWGENPYICGSYSYVKVGWKNGECYDILAEALTEEDALQDKEVLDKSKRASCPPKSMVFFSGEATHRLWYSTLHGAYESGKREASKILQTLQDFS